MLEREWCRERVTEWIRMGGGVREADVVRGRLLLEKWRMVDEEEAEEAEREINKVEKKARD